MLNRRNNVALAAAVLLAVGSLGLAAEETTAERFTFAAANAAAAGPAGVDRSELVVSRWSTQDERTRVLEAAEGEPGQLSRAVAQGWDAGYISLPGSLRYTLRYAHRTPRADGGEDVIVMTDRPIWWWWDPSRSLEAAKQNFSIIQLRLNTAGVGDGKVSASISDIARNQEAKTVMLEDYTGLPALLLDVRRQRE